MRCFTPALRIYGLRRGGADFQFYCDVFSICNLQSVWFAGCLRWSTGLLLGCFPMAPPHARRLASGVDCQLCSFSYSLCRSSRTVTAKPCNTYYRFWEWCWLRSRMGLAFDLAHHLAQQSYLRRVASVSASGQEPTYAAQQSDVRGCSALLYPLVGAGEERRRHVETQRLRGLELDELHSGRGEAENYDIKTKAAPRSMLPPRGREVLVHRTAVADDAAKWKAGRQALSVRREMRRGISFSAVSGPGRKWRPGDGRPRTHDARPDAWRQ